MIEREAGWVALGPGDPVFASDWTRKLKAEGPVTFGVLFSETLGLDVFASDYVGPWSSIEEARQAYAASQKPEKPQPFQHSGAHRLDLMSLLSLWLLSFQAAHLILLFAHHR